jgi:hypothetical protein
LYGRVGAVASRGGLVGRRDCAGDSDMLSPSRMITVKSPFACASAKAVSGNRLSRHLPLQFDLLPVPSRSK